MCTATTLHRGLMLEAFRSRNCLRLRTQAESDTYLNRARRYFQPALTLPTTRLSLICSWADSFFRASVLLARPLSLSCSQDSERGSRRGKLSTFTKVVQ